MSDGPALAIGIDVGGTKTAVVVTDETDRVLYERTVPTNADAWTDQIVGLVRETVAALESRADEVLGVGLAVPGHVDSRQGTVRMAVNVVRDEVALAAVCQAATGLPTVIEHDARAAAFWLYRRDRTPNVAYLTVGTGIAAGLVLDGVLLRGATGLAGEVGHVLADPDGPICPCGMRGCLEAVAAGPAIARAARERWATDPSATVLSADASAADVFDAARRGDAVATAVVEMAARHLARAIRGLVLAFGVDRVVIGGGVAAAGDTLLAPIRRELHDERKASGLAETALAGTSIEILPPGTNAGARGAAALAREAAVTAPAAAR
jgi:glucokinase